MTSIEDSPLLALWRRYLRAEDSFVEFRRVLLQTDMALASQLLEAYRAVREPITAESRERHTAGLATFAQHVLRGDALTARAALQILLDHDLGDLQHAIEFAEVDAYCSARLDDFSPFLAITARYKLERNGAERLMVRAASTLGMLAALEKVDWSPLDGCQLLIESGCHPLAVNIVARRSSPSLLIFESAAEQSQYEGLGIAGINLDEYFVLNSPQEIECYQGIEQMADEILTRCAATSIPWLTDLRKTLEVNRFVIEDSLYAANKRASALCDLMDNVVPGIPTLALLSQGRPLRLLAGAGRSQADLFYFWCNHRQFAQRDHRLRRFVKRVEAAQPPACSPTLLAALKPVLASYSRREVIRQWLRAKLPVALVRALVQLLGKRETLRRWKLWRPPLPRALRLWHWRMRCRLWDSAFVHVARRAMHDLGAPLDILFFTTGSPIYFDTVQDLMHHADKRGLRTSMVVRGLGNVTREDGPYHTIDYFEFMQQAPVRRMGKPLARYLGLHLRSLRLGKLMVLDSRYGPLDLNLTIRQGMEAIVSSALQRSHLFQILVRLMLKHARRVVVAPDRVPEALSVIQECRQHGLPTWTVQTVYHSRHPRYKPLQADFTTLIDTWSYSLFRDHFAVDARRLFITGSPRMRLTLGERQPTPRKQLLFICQRGVPFNLANLDYVLRNLVQFPDHDLVVRPHPSETPHQVRSYQTLLGQYGRPHATIDAVRPLREVMLETSAVLVAYSNVGLEAACYGIPVLVVNPMRIEYPVAMDEMGIGFAVSDDEQLRSALRRMRDEPAFVQKLADGQRRYLASNAGLLHGDPVERIVALIIADDTTRIAAEATTSAAVKVDGVSPSLQQPQDLNSV